MEIKIPYGKGFIPLKLDMDRVKGVLCSKLEEYEASGSQKEIVQKALENPIGSGQLKDLAKEAARLLLITSDHTRPVPSKTTLPLLLQEIRCQNPEIEIKILIATGFHRPTTREEMTEKFGPEIVENETIVNHDSDCREKMVFKGILPSGGELWLNSLVDWADLVVAEGFIEPHFFAGFSGGRKSILPGIAGKKTIFDNHCAEFIASERSRTGNLYENPIHKDMLFAAEKAKLQYILNVVIDGNKRIINAFAGHAVKAHEMGCAFLQKLARVDRVEGDIVITSNGGYPLDQNIYQAVKGMTAAEPCVKDGGIIIMVSACHEGHGGESFHRWFKEADSPAAVAEKISRISRNQTIADQWQAQILARVMEKCRVMMVSEPCSRRFIEQMHMTYAPSLEQAIDMANREMGEQAEVVVIPDGVGVIVKDS